MMSAATKRRKLNDRSKKLTHCVEAVVARLDILEVLLSEYRSLRIGLHKQRTPHLHERRRGTVGGTVIIVYLS
jgi:hypothetical protein